MIKSNYEVEVLVNGKPLKEYMHDRKVYVEGRQGTSFSLRLKNNSWQRKLFVPSIDGLSVMNGEDCDYQSGGYIVRPHSSITIEGWRVSDSEVAEFYFSSPSDSYRKRMQRGNNLGVIGVAVFDEKFKMPEFVITTSASNGDWSPQCTYTCSSAPSAYAMNASLSTRSASVKSNLGTGWGKSQRSEVVSVEFEQTNHPAEVFEIFYNTREQLERMGINFKKEPLYVSPQAFPGKFCPPPTR